ncbi:glutaredoxin family protein [Vibrio gallicus]|uniref:glutaredoxin family protein n=1 Tax=Vibrio gallicus TaxID=190897 RepID=UPI0021C306AA|nr:glutaredoxin domain-containing protein [Vibrio gallicus]
MKLIRILLGKIILLFDFIFSPRGVKRSPTEQAVADLKAKQLTLYQFEACPFCVKVRRELKRQSVRIDVKDAKNDQDSRQQLLEGGGRIKVPCLRIDNQGQQTWLYESSDIVAYLQKEFAA